ncbi:MAG: oligosaccharide flippase family protein [archaeon]
MKQDILIHIRDIFRRIKKRDFSGNTGIVVKNSIFQFLTNITAKAGSLLFTIILARILMPELFGLYSLALSTILILSTFSELGVGVTLTRFVSKEFGKNKKKNKAKSYTIYLGKLKLFLIFISMLILIISAKFISNAYYQKPIFLALIAGSLYILFAGIVAFMQSILQALNYFKGIFYKEIIFQAMRLIIIPLVVLLSLKQLFSSESLLFLIILGLGFSYLISLIFLIFLSKNKLEYLSKKEKKISFLEKKKVNKFILPVSALTITTAFFGYVDMVMLGRFVVSEYIGYYRAAFTLIAAMTSLISFSTVLLPIFSKLKNQQLERGFKKSLLIILWISFALFLFVLLSSSFIINLIYGGEYIFSINLLRFLSLLLISIPLNGIYISYFAAKGKPMIVTKLLIISLFMNITLNVLAILFLNEYGNSFVVYGVTGATIIGSWSYMFGLILSKKKEKQLMKNAP